MKLPIAFSMISLFCGTTIAMAAPDLYWHNTDGFKAATSCQVASVATIPFQISQGTDASPLAAENLRTYAGARQNYLLNRSLVRNAKGATKSGYTFINVIGVSQTPNAKTNKWFAERMDEGYVFNSSLKKLEDYVLELKEAPVKEISPLKVATKGSFWQLATENNQVQVFRCDVGNQKIDHLIFNVFIADQVEPIARIGVQPDHSAIFRSIVTHTVDEADKVIDARMVVQPIAAAVTDLAKSETAVNSGAQSTVPVAEQASATSTVDTDEEETDESLKLINSAQEHVVCINEDTLSVRDDSLENIIFRAEKNETVLPVQSWVGSDTKKKMINGTEYTFVKVQFPERSGQNIGWLAQAYVRLQGLCSVSKTEPAPTAPVAQTGPIKGIDSPACCGFPTIKRPTDSYLTGMRRFKAGRSKGRRLHAACDLYRKHGEETVSIAEGKVIQGLYSFYQGTYAVNVQYPGGFVVRYGELTGKKAKNVSTGAALKRGQIVGYIGTVNSGCCKPMLHFEVYSGAKKGSLSIKKGNKFQRRSDLIDPTQYLRRWEKNQFGTSY